uniref:alpha-N-acetylgalactosaminide alpha-2,6-sialyltransferase n=1 Tax=Lepisosteus oculatus TaxID=7918 RepID=W5MZQ7_LEPOC|nr:PREDICTED: alpha-N-acetylgalactosaminide alpha-2,6-sialyltransferase 1-like [Lepisosteus oculatus]
MCQYVMKTTVRKAFFLTLIMSLICLILYGFVFDVKKIYDIRKGDIWSRFLFVEDTLILPPLKRDDFKFMPHSDYDNLYLHDPHHRQTTCPESVMLSKDPEFKKAFIPNIQIFMHKEHFSIKEWNRLIHFNNPFGYMDANYTVLREAVQLIPKLQNYQLLPVPKTDKEGCIRCAVVASGGILNGSRKGKEIDDHDYVFRMNLAVTKGYEEDVGRKTSVYVHSAHALTTAEYFFGANGIPHDEGIRYVMIPEGMRDFQWLTGLLKNSTVATGPYKGFRPWKLYSGQFDPRRFFVLHPDFLRYVRNRFLRASQLNTEDWQIYRPTNGAFTMILALHTCDVVDAYGFITADHAKYPNYYFDKKKTEVIFYLNHDYDLEIRTWKKLHDAKIVNLYQRTEDAR